MLKAIRLLSIALLPIPMLFWRPPVPVGPYGAWATPIPGLPHTYQRMWDTDRLSGLVGLYVLPTPVPDPFRAEVLPLVSCESSWHDDAVKQEADGSVSTGLLQVNSQHLAEMARLGLDYNVEADRWRFAVEVLYPRQGVSAWSTAGNCGGKP